jgi:hypothetical protein
MKDLKLTAIIGEMYQENSLAQSVYSLAKNNNGYFKSDKQAAFLKNQIDKGQGAVGHQEAYGNYVTVFAEYDDRGITKIFTKSPKTGREVVKFQRMSDAEHKAQQDSRERFKQQQADYTRNLNVSIVTSKKEEIRKLESYIESLGLELEKYRESNPSVAQTLTTVIGRYVKDIEVLKQEIEDLLK